MNTTKILNRSLAWLSAIDKKTGGIKWDLFNLLRTTNGYSSGWLIGFESNRRNKWRYYSGNKVKAAANPIYNTKSKNQVAPQELDILTQIILHTLNSESGRFHNMLELPGLEDLDTNQLGQLAGYLVKQGWIEAQTMEDGLYIKLSIQGKIFVGNHAHDAGNLYKVYLYCICLSAYLPAPF